MQKNMIDMELAEHFRKYDTFTREEVFNYYRQYEPNLKKSTFTWRLYDLKRKHLIQEVGEGIYKVEDKQPFKPNIDSFLTKLYETINTAFFDINISVWSTSWINNYSRHQTFQNFYIVEISHELTEHLFNKLKELNYKNVFIKPDEKQIQNYVVGSDNPIIVMNLITKAPTKKVNKIIIPKLEKILVDLYADKKTFYMYQGNELKTIYEEAIRKHTVNFTKLFHYARRRGKEEQLRKYLKENLHNKVETIFND